MANRKVVYKNPERIIINKVSVELFDKDGNAVSVIQEGNSFLLATENLQQICLLENILKEFKIMNFYLSIVTDVEIDEGSGDL